MKNKMSKQGQALLDEVIELKCEQESTKWINNMPKKENKYTPEQYQAIKGLKQAIIEAFTVQDSPGMYKEVLQLIQDASELFEDFRKDIASKALRYKNISDKQAYCLAAGLIEEGVADYNKYMHYAGHEER